MQRSIQVEAIGQPEFINIVPYNPLYSQCEIKVFYLGENRNRSYIDKDTAIKMAASLPGSPIVGQFKNDKKDFGDHGERIVISGDGIEKECLTKPYGFVAPNAKVWFQKFKEYDEYGNEIIREYMMTTGYLWTGQFPECQCAIDEGRPHSMELDEDTLDGTWTKNYNRNVDFFIINDAIFSKLCILGEDVEPCFEGSSITSPSVTYSFTMDKTLTQTLFTMMQELKETLQEGGQLMPEKNFSENQDKIEKTDFNKNDNIKTGDTLENPTFKKEEEEEKTTSEDGAKEGPEEKKDETPKEDEKAKEKEDEDKKKYTLLEEENNALKNQYEELKNQFSLMEDELKELKAFKLAAENEKKDDLIKSFYMLSDEDKKEVVENKAKYSLDEIESKLSVICVRKKVSFDNQEEERADVSVTFNLDNDCGESTVPAWISAIRNTKNKNN